MKIVPLLTALMLSSTLTAFSAEKDTRVFEMRTYYAPAGKLDDLHARFRDHTVKLFEKHGITNIGYWVPIENTDNKLIYVIAFPSREEREKRWKEFGADEDWKKARADSEANGKLVAKVEQLFMTATDFSPEIKANAIAAGRTTGAAAPPAGGVAPIPASNRVFELRTYTTTPGNLPLLHARFREHTMALFAKHGMTNLFYWQLLPDQPAAQNTLIYMLAHASVDAAKASFAAFRADPDWVAAKKASEEKGGGSLTVPDGVKSVFLKATDYSPTR